MFPEGEWVDRDRLEYKYFVPWVDFAKENSLGIDFNPTCFSHPMVKDGLTLSHPDEAVRRFWIDHCKASRRIAQRIGEELGIRCSTMYGCRTASRIFRRTAWARGCA